VKRVAPRLTLLAATTVAACGYFNTMYNADRAFGEAERAAARGELSPAASAYTRAAEKAASQIAKDSVGRYSDDAMLILGRSWFALGRLDSADVILRRLADREDTPLRHNARAWHGAVAAARGDTAAALASLNAALQADRLDAYTAAIARVWRARVYFAQNNFAAAGEDLAAARTHDRTAAPAALLAARIALESGDTLAARTHFDQLFKAAGGAFFTDSIRALTRQYRDRTGPAALAAALSSVHEADWPRMRRDSIAMLLVTLLEQSGDTTSAIAEAERIARRSTPPLSDEARVAAARMMLTRANGAADLAAVRNLLLPALGNQQARTIVQTLRTIDVLQEIAANAEPLALFVAAEISRDQLAAPGLARRLFIAYADAANASDWSGKALLAAMALPQPADSADVLRRRIGDMSGNIYIAAVHGRDDHEAFANAEERLARSASALRAAAMLEAGQRETTVGRAVALIDSLRLAARTDSLRLSCGVFIDSLAVTGIRADSIRSACMRNDRERIDLLIQIDTTLLRDTTQIQPDSLRARTDSTRVRTDSIDHPR